MGDLNSRTGQLLDYDNQDDEIPGQINFGRTAIPTVRNSCDKQNNQMGLKLVDLCQAHDLQIINGRTAGVGIGTNWMSHLKWAKSTKSNDFS